MFEEKLTFTCKNQPKKKEKNKENQKAKTFDFNQGFCFVFWFWFCLHLVFRQKPNILKNQYLCVYVYNIYICIYMCVCVWYTPPETTAQIYWRKTLNTYSPKWANVYIYIYGTPLAQIYWRKREKRIPQNMQKSTVNISKSSKKVGFWGTHIYIYLLVIPWWLSSC